MNTTRRTSSRKRAANQDVSEHPNPNAKDASVYHAPTLQRLQSTNITYFNRLDFVRVPDDVIERLFVTDRIREKMNNNIPYPPLALRRTATQIRDFYKLGAGQCRQQIEKYENYEIIATQQLETIVEEPDLVEESKTNHARLFRKHATSKAKKWRRLLRFPFTGLALRGNKEDDVRWTLNEQLPVDADDEMDESDDSNMPELEEIQDFHDLLSFRDVSCTGGDAVNGTTLCESCLRSREAFIRRCASCYDLRDKPVSQFTNNRHLTTMSLKSAKIEDQRKTIEREKKNKEYWRKRYDQLSDADNGISVPINEDSNAIFTHEGTEHLQKWFASEPTKASTAEYIFAEACRKHDVAKKSGATAVRHCPLAYRLGMVIRKKMGYAGGLYDLLAASMGIPSDRSLNEYIIPSSNDGDGIMYKNIAQEADLFRKNNPDCPLMDWDRMGSVAFDSMSVKSRLVVNHHTNELVGYGHDVFEKDTILAELEELEAADEDGLESMEHQLKSDKTKSEKKKMPELAKHFLVVIFTTLSASAKHKHTILVARYGLKTIDEPILDKVLTEAFIALARDGWIAIQVTGDGASENRSYFKSKATITAGEVFDGHYPEDLDLAGLPLDVGIAFPHPDPYLRDNGVIIIIGGEMPHWVKKFRNNMCSSKRTLTYNGQTIELSKFKKVWIESGDADISSASLRLYKFTHDHFDLNSYNKMRVFLAMQICSLTMLYMLQNHCKPVADGGMGGDLAEFAPAMEIITAVNRLIDIMNGVRFKNGKDKEVELIDSPIHYHIFELFDILRLFEDWKKQAGGFSKPHKFITRQTYEDLVWMVYGVAAVACTYLEEDGSRLFHQGREGSDVCEHFFCSIRNINPNPTLQQIRQAASKCANFVKSNIFSWKGKQNAAGANRDHSDYMQPMMKKKKQKK